MQKLIEKATYLQVLIALFSLGLIVYFLSFLNGFVADDNVQILANPAIRNLNIYALFTGSSYFSGDLASTSGIYYKPIFTLVTSIFYNLFSGSPFGLHFVQFLLHVSNSFLVFVVFKKFFSKQLSLVLSFIFLVHPGNTESVVYISNLQDVLFPFFGLSSILVSYSKLESQKRYFLVFLLLLCSLLSKESGILFVLILPFFLFALKKPIQASLYISGSVLFSYIILRFVIAQVGINHQVISPIMAASTLERLQTVPLVVYSFIKLFVFPLYLSWGQHWIVKEISFWNFWLPAIVTTGSLVCFGLLVRKSSDKQKRGGILFGLVAILGVGLHSQLVPLDFTFAERWLYFPMIGFLGITGYALGSIRTSNRNAFLIISFVILVSVLSIRSFVRSLDWKDDFTLASRDIKVNPDSMALQNNYGFELMKKGDYKTAVTYLEKSANTFSDTSSYNNLAFSYAKLGKHDKAIVIYKKALVLNDFYLTYQNYIAELIRQEKLDEARKVTQESLKKFPNNNKLWLLASLIEYKNGNIETAIYLLSKAEELVPGSSQLLYKRMQNKEDINL